MFRAVLLLTVIVLFCPTVAQAVSCAQDNRVVGSCYDVHGHLAIYANMRPRLQPDGTEDLLAIVPASGLETGETDYYWPHEVGEILSTDVDIVADFHVCPFTLPEAKKMQFVCIEAVSGMKTEPSSLAAQRQENQ